MAFRFTKFKVYQDAKRLHRKVVFLTKSFPAEFYYLKDQLRDPKVKKAYEEERHKLTIGYQIFLARDKAGLTQAELAKRIGTRQSNISRLEQGDYNFTLEMLEKIAKALRAEIRIELVTKNFAKAA